MICLPTGGNFLRIHPGMVFISREISDRDKKVLMLLYKELLRPHLKYREPQFPVLRNGAFKLEQVQRRISRMG